MHHCKKDSLINVKKKKREEEIALGNRLTGSKLFGVGWAPTFFSFHLTLTATNIFSDFQIGCISLAVIFYSFNILMLFPHHADGRNAPHTLKWPMASFQFPAFLPSSISYSRLLLSVPQVLDKPKSHLSDSKDQSQVLISRAGVQKAKCSLELAGFIHTNCILHATNQQT